MVAHDESFSDPDESGRPRSNSKRTTLGPIGGRNRGDPDGSISRSDDDGGRGRRPWAPAGSPQDWRGVTALEPPPRPSRTWADVPPRVNLKRPHELPPAAAAAAFRKSQSPGRRSRSPERGAGGRAGAAEGAGRAVLRLSFRGRPLNRTRRVRARRGREGEREGAHRTRRVRARA